MIEWIYRGPTNAGPWKGGYYIATSLTAEAFAYAKDEQIAKQICDAANEIARLQHDLDRHISIAADMATEMEELRELVPAPAPDPNERS